MGQRLPDLIVIVESCVLFVLVTMLWIHRARPANVASSTLSSVLIPARILFVHALLFVPALPFPGLIAQTGPIIVVIALCVLPFATIDYIPGGDKSAFSVGRMLMIPIYGLRQFIIGFPDREALMERKPNIGTPLFDPDAALWADDE